MLPAAKVLLFWLIAALCAGNLGCDGVRELLDLDVLALEHLQQLNFAVGFGGIGSNDIGGGALEGRFLDRAFALGVVVLEEVMRMLREVRNRRQQRALFVVVVVALRPGDDGQWRILAVPGARIFLGREDALFGVGAAVAEGLIEAADAVVHGGEEHEVAGAPGVEVAVGEDAGHAEVLHLRDVVPAEFGPLVGEQRIDPGVVRTVAHGVVVEEGHGFVQVMQNLRVPVDVGVEHVARQVECHAHGVAIVVVGNVVAPVEQVRPLLVRVGLVPAIDVDHAVAAIDFDHGRDEHDHVRADVLDVG